MHQGGMIAISVGNTRTRVGWFTNHTLGGSEVVPNDDMPSIITAVGRAIAETESAAPVAYAIASVNDPVAERLISAAVDQHGITFDRIGEDIPLPLTISLDPETMTGVDRLLGAVAAYHTLRQACIIIDAGTAVTIDFVDGAGVFHGGSIAPGAQMQLDALHAQTALLPELAFRAPDAMETFGKSTAEAMLNGVYHGIRGMVARLVERYAEAYGAYPTVIATGGDAPLLFSDDPLIDRIVPDLPLMGIAVSVRAALERNDAPEGE